MTKEFYDSPGAMEPMVPGGDVQPLVDRSVALALAAGELKAALHTSTARTLSRLLRSMNSYYSNKIEGHSTHPINIERSLRADFSKAPHVAKLQRLALAHIEAEKEIENWVIAGTCNPFSQDGLSAIHRALYGRLSEADRTTEDGLVVEPGALRTKNVQVGRHVPPAFDALPRFLARFASAYDHAAWNRQLVMIAAAHHRFTWVHPFVDGNGRVARLASHAALYQSFTAGLWSVCRGLARKQSEYYQRLEDADEPRRGDLDGRGNLSQMGLRNFCEFFLDVCTDQLAFMKRLFNLDGLGERIRALVVLRSATEKDMRPEACLPLLHMFATGPMTRAEFRQATGLSGRSAQRLLAHLLKTGLVESDSPLGNVSFGMPLDALQFYFPDLYPEAATQPP